MIQDSNRNYAMSEWSQHKAKAKTAKERKMKESGSISMTLPCVRMMLQYVVSGRSHDSSVSIVNQLDWIIWTSIHGRGLLQNVQTDSVIPPAFYQWLMGVTTLIPPLA